MIHNCLLFFQGVKGEFQSLEILSDIVRKELRKRSKWLLIIDNLSGSSYQNAAINQIGGSIQFEGGSGSMTPALPIQQNDIITGSVALLVHLLILALYCHPQCYINVEKCLLHVQVLYTCTCNSTVQVLEPL